MQKQSDNKIGNLHPPGTLFFRISAGEAGPTEDGTTYELSTNVGGGHPIIGNNKTGRYWSITWQQLLQLARENGLDEPVKKPREK